MWLPSPWWWIACLAIIVVTTAALAALDDARTQQVPATASEGSRPTRTSHDAPSEIGDQRSNGTGGYDALSGVVFLVGIYNGVAPFIARLVFDGDLLWALPLRLSTPWWWITSLVAIVATIALLALIDGAKQRRHADG
jgi:hypothetical protein